MSFTFDSSNVSGDGSYQGQLASSYTNALSEYLQTEEGADYVAFLAYQGGMSVEEALAIKVAITNGEFDLSGLFGAAQNKAGAVVADITDPVPTLTVGEFAFDLTAMLGILATDSWDTVTKKDTITHTREFYSASATPDGYSDDWANPPQLEQHFTTETITITKPQGADDFNQDGYFTLLGQDWGDFEITVSGIGDYDRNTEGFTVSGDADASYLGSTSSGPNNEATNTTVASFDGVFDDTDTDSDGIPDWAEDGTFDYNVAIADPTASGAAVTLTFEYSYWI
ncbi:hypothetical protein [Rhodoferax sp.]|uniref:hypothetical protein n=1 Tax=Rhodoferax sp. TaxID=50421 RepID=UPI00272FCCFA|nr:hypothetical protein [Rhodoferax sp.]MDP2441500.1 hypothetical protein [Rhodoferax sp.]MDZ4207362.1 hypothetical protein [Rhodoferax sp.]